MVAWFTLFELLKKPVRELGHVTTDGLFFRRTRSGV
jgi:hypothetical protein